MLGGAILTGGQDRPPWESRSWVKTLRARGGWTTRRSRGRGSRQRGSRARLLRGEYACDVWGQVRSQMWLHSSEQREMEGSEVRKVTGHCCVRGCGLLQGLSIYWEKWEGAEQGHDLTDIAHSISPLSATWETDYGKIRVKTDHSSNYYKNAGEGGAWLAQS